MTGILRHLLVATDGSATGNRAVGFGIALALRHDSTILFCSVVDHAAAIGESSAANGGFGVLIPLVQTLDDAADSILAEAAKRATGAGVTATTAVLDGHSATAIVMLAQERHVDAIVMGTQGKRGFERFFMGSTADGVLRRTDVPTFVVPPGGGDAEPSFERILIAVDDSEPSDAAATFARDFAKAEGAQLIFCGVLDTSDLFAKASTYGYDPTSMLDELHASASSLVARQTDHARVGDLAIDSIIIEGDPAEKILESAAARHVGLIVVGTHGRRGLRRLFVGSVAESVVRRSTVPVIVVRTSPRPDKTQRESALATSAICYT